MGEDGYTWVVCEVCGKDKFGMRRGQTLNVKFRERRLTVVGGTVSMTCTACGAITTVNLDTPTMGQALLEGEGRTAGGE
jgi:hypothetical protein